MSEYVGVSKLPTLTGTDDFVNWCRSIKAYLQVEDIDLSGVANRPKKATAAEHCQRIEANITGKSAITMTLTNWPLAQVGSFLYDEKKLIWNYGQSLKRLIKR